MMKPVRIYQNGYRIGVLYKEGRKYDHVVTLDYPIKRTRVEKGTYEIQEFDIGYFIERLAYRVNAKWYTKYIIKEILDLVPKHMIVKDNPRY